MQIADNLDKVYFAVTSQEVYVLPDPVPLGRSAIHFLEFATGKATPVVTIEGWPDVGLSVSPDRRTILFAQIDHQSSDLVLVEYFR